jgi:hypothetical protein
MHAGGRPPGRRAPSHRMGCSIGGSKIGSMGTVRLFLWQFPRFMAIAWMYREDYARAGYLVLPPGGAKGPLHGLHQLPRRDRTETLSIRPFTPVPGARPRRELDHTLGFCLEFFRPEKTIHSMSTFEQCFLELLLYC